MSTSAQGGTPAGASWYVGYALLLLVLASLAALFYFGGFTYLLSNSSSSFNVEVCRTEIKLHRDANVLVIGNSTAAEDFRTTLYNSQSKNERAINLGVPGGHFFLFEKMIEMSRDMGVRPRAAVLILTPEVLSLRPNFDYLLNDLGTLKIRLDLGDLATLAWQSRAVPQYLDYASRVLLRPVLFRGDLLDLFSRPRERWHEAITIRKWLDGLRPQDPPPESTNAFQVCGIPSLDRLPQEIQEQRRAGHADVAAEFERVEAGYAVRVHQPLQIDGFETIRFERVLRRLVQDAGNVYVVQAPYYDPTFEQYPATYRRSYEAAVRAVVQRTPGATLVPDFSADCGMFFDTVHLNAAGAARFTAYLRSYIAAHHRIAQKRPWQAKPPAPQRSIAATKQQARIFRRYAALSFQQTALSVQLRTTENRCRLRGVGHPVIQSGIAASKQQARIYRRHAAMSFQRSAVSVQLASAQNPRRLRRIRHLVTPCDAV